MAELQLPFSLKKPSANEYVTQADTIGYGQNSDVKKELDNLNSQLTNIDPQAESHTVGDINAVDSNYDCLLNDYVFCNKDSMGLQNISLIAIKVYPNTTFNIYKVNTQTKVTTLLGSVTNNSDGWANKSLSVDLSLGDNEYIGVQNTETTKNVPTSIVESSANLIRLKISTGNTSTPFNTYLPLAVTYNTYQGKTLNEKFEEMDDSIGGMQEDVATLVEGQQYTSYEEHYVGDDTPTISGRLSPLEGSQINCLKVNSLARVTKVKCQVYPGTTYNVYKVDFSEKTYTKIGELTNSGENWATIEITLTNPVSLTANQFIGIQNTETGKGTPYCNTSATLEANIIQAQDCSNGAFLRNRELSYYMPMALTYETAIHTTVKQKVAELSTEILNGKTIAILGDSFTANPNRYITELEHMSGCTVLNYGVGGTRMVKVSANDTTSFEARYPSMSDDVDMVIIFGGTNDFGYGNYPFGEFLDGANPTKFNFYAGLHRLFKGIYDKYRGKPILIITPCHRGGIGSDKAEYNIDVNDGTLTPVTSEIGKTLKEYVNAIKEVAQFYSFYLADAYSEVGFNPTDDGYYLVDGLHPNFINGKGNTRLAKWMKPHIERAYIGIYGK